MPLVSPASALAPMARPREVLEVRAVVMLLPPLANMSRMVSRPGPLFRHSPLPEVTESEPVAAPPTRERLVAVLRLEVLWAPSLTKTLSQATRLPVVRLPLFRMRRLLAWARSMLMFVPLEERTTRAFLFWRATVFALATLFPKEQAPLLPEVSLRCLLVFRRSVLPLRLRRSFLSVTAELLRRCRSLFFRRSSMLLFRPSLALRTRP